MFACMYTYETSCGGEIEHGVIEKGGTLGGNTCEVDRPNETNLMLRPMNPASHSDTLQFSSHFLFRTVRIVAYTSLTSAKLRVFTLGKRRCTWLPRNILSRLCCCYWRPRPTATFKANMGTAFILLSPLLSITISCRVYACSATYLSIGLLSYANRSFVASFSVFWCFVASLIFSVFLPQIELPCYYVRCKA
jgi:hypothetical protein